MYPDRFPRNAWYVAARSTEVGRTILSRWLLGDPVALYRQEDGKPVAVVDRCIHRQMPLSLGKLIGDRVQCGYHGLTFAPDGSCVRVPGSKNISPRIRVQTFPLYEQYGLIWIWMGDPDQADTASIPDHHWFRDSKWATSEGTLHMDGRAQLLIENLLDLSHLTFLHPDSIGTDDVAEAEIKTEFAERLVRVTRWMKDVTVPPFFEKVMGVTGPIDRGQIVEFFAPSFHLVQTLIKPVSHMGDDIPFRQMVAHAITPETRTTSHYFWGLSRNFSIEDTELTQYVVDAISRVFTQDIEACEAIEHILSAWEPSYPMELSIKVDPGPLRARKIIEEMASEEFGPASPPAAPSDGAARKAAAASRAR